MWPYTTQERNWLAAAQPAAQAPLTVPQQQVLPFAEFHPSGNNDNAPYDPMIFVAK